ncbi:MAG: polysaccharide biosynthesis tyrosine autokinase [Nocardioides sp.]
MTFLDFLRLTRVNFLVILAAVTVGVLAMFLYTLRQPVVYTATSQGYVVVGTAATAGELITTMDLQQQKAESYVTLISDRRVADLVAQSLNQDGAPEAIAGSLSASVAPNSGLLAVSATAGSPEAARDLANAAVVALGEVAHDVENAGLAEGQQEVDLVSIVPGEEALLPGAPSSPDYQRNLLAGAAGGLLLGYAIALLRRSVDRKVRNVGNVEEAGVGSVVGIIPVADPLSKSNRGVSEDLGVVAEAFRQLRTNLRFVDVDHPPRSIVVTSANAGEGKSTVSANLARMMAAAGQPTLLIDADLRRPSLASTFDLDPVVGLTQVLVGDLAVADVLQETRTPNLQVVTAGRIPPNPSELLGSQRMHSLVEELTKEFIVILDAPPLLPVTDAGLLTATCDGALLVVAVGKTHVEQVELCGKVLGRVGGRLLGCVLNLAPRRGLGAVVYGYGGGKIEQGYGDTSPVVPAQPPERHGAGRVAKSASADPSSAESGSSEAVSW